MIFWEWLCYFSVVFFLAMSSGRFEPSPLIVSSWSQVICRLQSEEVTLWWSDHIFGGTTFGQKTFCLLTFDKHHVLSTQLCICLLVNSAPVKLSFIQFECVDKTSVGQMSCDKTARSQIFGLNQSKSDNQSLNSSCWVATIFYKQTQKEGATTLSIMTSGLTTLSLTIN